MSRREPLRIAVLGLGAMGSTHLRLLRDLGRIGSTPVTVTVLADPDEGRLRRAAADSAALTITDARSALLDADLSTNLDAVVIASPDATHPELVRLCLNRGLPVLCEKPLSLSAQVADDLVAQERDTGRRLVQVGFMRRYDTEFATVATHVRNGMLGPPALLRTVHHNPWQGPNVGPQTLLRSSAPHDIDLLRWVTGDEPLEVDCQVTGPDASGFTAMLLRIRLRRGAIGVVELVQGRGCEYRVGLEVVGPAGCASTGLRTTSGWAARFEDAYRAQLLGWLAAVADAGPEWQRDPASASADDGAVASRALVAAERSWLDGGRAVSLSETG